ncbi:hypothetical protein BKA64DRAFT_266599 [Cadophora sp. MPI-SDFR-AT-0126]|nr:hypothetical protein BKA64DRAFT_266599 [Leotiomycetes sp. MPI-SDFR-AT-0126]
MSATGMAREATLQAMQRSPRSGSPTTMEHTMHDEDTTIASDDDSNFVPHWVFEMVKRFFTKPPIPIPVGMNQSMFIPHLTGETLGSLKATLRVSGPQAAYAELEEKMMDWIDPFRMKPVKRTSAGGLTIGAALSELKSISATDGSSTVKPSSVDTPLTVADISSPLSSSQLPLLPCKYHILGACPDGTSCPFSHELERTKRTVCTYFLKVWSSE